MVELRLPVNKENLLKNNADGDVVVVMHFRKQASALAHSYLPTYFLSTIQKTWQSKLHLNLSWLILPSDLFFYLYVITWLYLFDYIVNIINLQFPNYTHKHSSENLDIFIANTPYSNKTTRSSPTTC